jgi:molybdenum cofactor cytidylyltransferase
MITGILLAAGSGSRFGADKLLHPLADGTPIGVVSLRALKSALSTVIAVIRTGDGRLRALLADEQVDIFECDDAHLGMARSFVCGIEASRDAEGWVIALGDMPFIQPRTIKSVATSVAQTGRIIVPAYLGQRGHPVGFGRRYLSELQKLSGDEGARSVILRHPGDIELLECDDAGIVRDIDTLADLKGSA